MDGGRHSRPCYKQTHTTPCDRPQSDNSRCPFFVRLGGGAVCVVGAISVVLLLLRHQLNVAIVTAIDVAIV